MTKTHQPIALVVPKGAPLVPGKLYLRLFHGRTDPAEEMTDWGFTGPTYGPLSAVVQTYTTTIRAFGEEITDELWIDRHGDMVRWDGCFFGDMEVFLATENDRA